MAEKFPDAYWKSCGDKWWDDYDFQEVVIIDEYYGWLPYSYLLRLLDRYPLNVESKGGMLNFNPKQVWICSNNSIDDWYKWSEKLMLEPLMRRVDFYARMKSDGTFDIKKGNNPFDPFPAVTDVPPITTLYCGDEELTPINYPDIGDSQEEQPSALDPKERAFFNNVFREPIPRVNAGYYFDYTSDEGYDDSQDSSDVMCESSESM